MESCPTFVLGSEAVVDSHAVDTIEGIQPDIVVVSKRCVCTKTQNIRTSGQIRVSCKHEIKFYLFMV